MSAPAIQLQPSALPARRGTLDDDILGLLREAGPVLTSDLRTSLMIASKARLDAALLFLVDEGAVERVSAGAECALRIPGDTRPVPETMTRAVERTTYQRLRLPGARS